MTEIENDILVTLAYFDIFKYPLTRRELFLFLGNNYQQQEFEESVTALAAEKVIFRFLNFYSLLNDPSLSERRIKGNDYAKQLLKTAMSVSALLAKFPYVRGIAVSGSLSKNFADKSSDIDLFIITAKNRVWITRTMMHCLKKVSFLFNKEHLFCMNYYIDESELEIAEKNIYTAIEIATLMPMQGTVTFENFYAANNWTKAFLPNHSMRILSAPPINMSIAKSFTEIMFNNSLGDWADSLLMKITSHRWMKKTKQLKVMGNGFVMSLNAGKHHAKPDPANFQATLLKSYEFRVRQVLQL